MQAVYFQYFFSACELVFHICGSGKVIEKKTSDKFLLLIYNLRALLDFVFWVLDRRTGSYSRHKTAMIFGLVLTTQKCYIRHGL